MTWRMCASSAVRLHHMGFDVPDAYPTFPSTFADTSGIAPNTPATPNAAETQRQALIAAARKARRQHSAVCSIEAELRRVTHQCLAHSTAQKLTQVKP